MASSNLTTPFEASRNADEIELICMASGVPASLDSAIFDDRISGEISDDPSSDYEARWADDTRILDEAAEAAVNELKRRSDIPGGGYPFKLRENSLVHVESRTLAYEFCLAISLAPQLTSGEWVRLPRNFERLCAIAAELYLGEGSESLRMGSPTDREDPAGHPKNFSERVALLRKKYPASEWILNPTPGFEARINSGKDRKMDFAAWKRFPDDRIGRLTLIGQCACGRNDQNNDEKVKELDFDVLNLIFRPLTWLRPVKVFATPYHVVEATRLIDIHNLQNIAFDRLRIATFCEHSADDVRLKKLRSTFAELIRFVSSQT